jgi:hypothetical protein
MELKYDALEMSRIIGEPKNPQKPYSDLVMAVCEVETAEPNEYVYYFDVLAENDAVYVITSTGAVTLTNVTPDTPAAMTFIDVATAEIYAKYNELASAKERTLARKLKFIERSLNAYENNKVISLIDAAVPVGNSIGKGSGASTFNYERLVTMIDSVQDYSDGYVLLAGTTIDKDIKLWDWTDNKYTSLSSALKDLNVQIIRQFGTFATDGGSQTAILSSTLAYLVGTSTEVGKPVLFVRKMLNDVEMIGRALYENGEKPQRLVLFGQSPVVVGNSTDRFLGVSMIGWEQIAGACKNAYALAKFNRNS